ncbi:hypothetical protein [Butyrivibrio sp. MC2013]|uniref:hypothetical protein n=1 Tax=Butyrivibrio sp. MC2013 TaxID=1280686 RepID=UPI00041B636C|nr:hypothetical protein [Butyrivibrio sp. MC2013]
MRIKSIFIIGIIIISIFASSCGLGKKDALISSAEIPSSEFEQKEFIIEGDQEISSSARLTGIGDKIYLTDIVRKDIPETASADDFLFAYEVLSFDADGKILSENYIPLSDTLSMSDGVAACYTENDCHGLIDSESNLYLAGRVLPDDTDNHLIKYNEYGEKEWEVDFESDYIYDAYIVSDDCIAVCFEKSLTLFSTHDGSEIYRYSPEGGDICSIILVGNGLIYVHLSSEDADKVEVISEEGRIGTNKVSFLNGYDTYNYFPALSGLLLVTNDKGIYEYNAETDELKTVCMYMDYGIVPEDVVNVARISDDSYLLLIESGDSVTLSELKKVTDIDNDSKTELILGCWQPDLDVQREVAEFNKQSSDYRIIVRDYYDLEETDTDAAALLYKDILNGNAPDIMLLQDSSKVEWLKNLGMIEALDVYIKNDPDFDVDDCPSNIQKAFYPTGDIWSIVPAYKFNTVVVRPGSIRDWTKWCFDGIEDIAEESGIPVKTFFGDNSSTDFIADVFGFEGAAFCNDKSGKCDFDHENFRRILELSNKMKKEDDPSIESDESISLYQSGRALAKVVSLSCLQDYLNEVRGDFGTDVDVAGFPGEEGGISCLEPVSELCIYSEAKDKKGCWEFVSSFLKSDYQDSIKCGFPVRSSSIEKHFDEYMYKEDSKFEAYPDGDEIQVDGLSEAEREMLLTALRSADKIGTTDPYIYNIIYEEAQSYWAGQKSAADVCDIIQNRVELYLKERSQ